jgi:hypothetical protein
MSGYDTTMPRAVLVLADLYAASSVLPDVSSVRRLPSLERALARATSHAIDAADWRRWLSDRLGAPPRPVADVPAWWLATPVHYIAGLDTLRLHGDGLLRLSLPMQQQLVVEFARVFDGSGWRLLATGARELLLQGPALAAEAPDPAHFLGQSTREAQPRGKGVEVLRRLQGEVEMWLYGANFHGSGAATQLKVSGLWLWGRSFAAPLATNTVQAGRPPGGTVAQLYADDLAARACAAAAGVPQSELPQRWPEDEARGGDLYVVINVAGSDVTAQLEDVEARWFAPALAACAAGRFASLELVCGARRWQLDGSARWRFWRRPRHWLPELLAC